MPRKNEPKKAETRQRKNCRLKFPPNLVSLAHPSLDGVIKNYQRSDRSENADHLNQPNPNIPAITEQFKMSRRRIGDKTEQSRDKNQVQRKNDSHG